MNTQRRLRSSLRSALGFVVLCAVTLIVSPVDSQETSSASFEEIVEVELVNVEVRVVDKQGKPVAGLTVDDFQVFQDSRPITIWSSTSTTCTSTLGIGES